jgi:hypothetical protein
MPNHIKNRLTFTGDQLRIDELVAKFSTHHPSCQHESYDGAKTFKNDDGKYGWLKADGLFSIRGEGGEIVILDSMPPEFNPSMSDAWDQFPDFKKIITQPEGIDITSNGLVNYLENQFSERDPILELKNAIEKAPLESVENFCKAIMNLKKHGHASWYGWSIANWGTKWNSYSCEKMEGNVWEFDTAWSGVPKLIEVISLAFPDISILYEFADEDTGSGNCGILFFQDGEIKVKNNPESQSNDAFELCFKLRPDYAENYHLVDGKYKYKDDDDSDDDE